MQETDGSTLMSLLWIAWVYWIWIRLNQFLFPDPNDQKGKSNGISFASSTGAVRAILDLSSRDEVIANPRLADALHEIQRRDRSFAVTRFLERAGRAYEEITIAFATGDTEMLEICASHEVYHAFLAAIIAREGRGERTEATFVRIAPPELVDAGIHDGGIEISVRFIGELFSVTRNAAGAIVGGDPERSIETADVWTFAKAASSHDDGWKLVSSRPA